MPHPPAPTTANPIDSASDGNLAQDAWSYWLDACQRSLLFLDVLQQRSDRYQEHNAKVAPHVLKFGCEVVLDGRKLRRPVQAHGREGKHKGQ